MKNIVAISVEKIQRYIFHRIDMAADDRRSLQSVILSSNRVSGEVIDAIRSEFNLNCEEDKEKIILCISGKIIFACHLSESEIFEKLSDLNRLIYIRYQGNISLNSTVFRDMNNKMDIIREAERRLKSHDIMRSKLMVKNQETLFQFQETEDISDFRADRDETEDECISKAFVKSMDDLVYKEDCFEDEPDGKIAIVKADINNLGKIMSQCSDYGEYCAISRTLEEQISIHGLLNCILNYSGKNLLINKILPFYIAGDDIFYAVKVGALFDSIQLLHQMMNKINEKIQSLSGDTAKPELTLAVGAVFVNSHQPIRYYRQAVEAELHKAKLEMKTRKSINSKMGIGINGVLFYIYEGMLGHGESDGFFRFWNEVKELKRMLESGLFTRSYLYNLLVNLESEKDEEKQLLFALYHLRPVLRTGEKLNEDAYFKFYWLSQLVDDGDGSREERFFSRKKIAHMLEKLKLILHFLKPEYTDFQAAENYKFIIFNPQSRQENIHDKIKSVMFQKPINYLLKCAEAEEESIELLFMKIRRINQKCIYQSAGFDLSLFYRAKELWDSGKKDRIPILFRNYYQSVVKNREESNSIHRLKFKPDDFNRRLKRATNCSWLDRLIVLFYYNQQRIIYKTTAKFEKNKNRMQYKKGRFIEQQ